MATKKKKAAPKKAASTFTCSKCGRILKSKGGLTVHERSCTGAVAKEPVKKTAPKKAAPKKTATKKSAVKKTVKNTKPKAAVSKKATTKKVTPKNERRSLPIEARRHHSHLISPVQPTKKKRSGFSMVTVGEIYLTTVLFCLIIFGASYWTVALSELFGWADTITTSTDILAQRVSLLHR